MASAPTWVGTIHWLATQPDGATWQEVCLANHLTRDNWRAQLTAARAWVKEHPELHMALPRAVPEDGWKFRVTRKMSEMKPGQIGDDQFTIANLTRVLGEREVAYDDAVATEPAGRRSVKAKDIQKLIAGLSLVIEALERDAASL